MGCKLVEKVLKFTSEHGVGKRNFKKHKSKKTFFHVFLFGNVLNKFQFGLSKK